MSFPDFQSYAGPGDKYLPNDEVQGYQPVSRIGEVVMNAFVDPFEFQVLNPITMDQMLGGHGFGNAQEHRPMFHEWATVLPGMITISKKKKIANYRRYVAAETAVPVIACASCLTYEQEEQYFFSGVARSKSVRTPSDGRGPSVDEFFTVSIGGLVTILNTSGDAIFPGDSLQWTLAIPYGTKAYKSGDPTHHLPDRRLDQNVRFPTSSLERGQSTLRRIAIKACDPSAPNVIGTAKSFAKAGETLDVLLRM